MQANRRIFWLGACLALTLALALVVPTHAGLGDSDHPRPSQRTLADKPKSRTHDVDITGKGFSPNRLTLKAGDSVSWTNTDSRDHTVTGPGFGSGNIKPGGRFSFRFPKPGNYPYSCSLHPRMKGTIIVQP